MGLDLLQLEVGPLRVENGAAGGDGHVGEGVLAVVSEALGMEKKNFDTIATKQGFSN